MSTDGKKPVLTEFPEVEKLLQEIEIKKEEIVDPFEKIFKSNRKKPSAKKEYIN